TTCTKYKHSKSISGDAGQVGRSTANSLATERNRKISASDIPVAHGAPLFLKPRNCIERKRTSSQETSFKRRASSLRKSQSACPCEMFGWDRRLPQCTKCCDAPRVSIFRNPRSKGVGLTPGDQQIGSNAS